MENTQQQLIIDDLNYCDTVCDDTEAIVGGRRFWNAIKDSVRTKVNARRTTIHDLFTLGTLPTGQRADDLLEPLPFTFLRHFFH